MLKFYVKISKEYHSHIDFLKHFVILITTIFSNNRTIFIYFKIPPYLKMFLDN